MQRVMFTKAFKANGIDTHTYTRDERERESVGSHSKCEFMTYEQIEKRFTKTPSKFLFMHWKMEEITDIN